jgi:hypothetical protein
METGRVLKHESLGIVTETGSAGSRQGRTVGLRAIHHWLWVLPQDKI